MRAISWFHLAVVFSFQPDVSDNLLHSGLGSEDEVRLVDNLFMKQGYNPLIRPVQNQNDSLNVDFNMALIQLINVDEKNQILKTNVWLRMFWHDYQLEWDPYDYGGISVIRMLAEEVWKPDIVLFNNADGRYEVSYKSNVVLQNNGHVMWIPPAIYKSSCTIDVEYFPFDEQECEMKFGSWTFNGDQVRLGFYERNALVDLRDYVTSGTWDVMSCPGKNSFEYDKSEGHNKSHIVYRLKIRRKTLFYTINLIIPCVLISFLSVCVFFLPADALEKMTMCISILLALVVFLLLVSKILPPTSLTIPLIAKYLLFTFIMNIFTILITVIIINWNFRTPRTHKMPEWVRSVFLNYLPRLIFMKRPSHDSRVFKKAYNLRHDAAHTSSSSSSSRSSSYRKHRTRPNSTESTSYSNDSVLDAEWRDGRGNRSRVDHVTLRLDESASPSSPVSPPLLASSPVERFPMSAEAYKAMEAVRFIAAHLKNEDDYAEVLEDWRYIALVIDRLQLYIFFAVTICGTIGILINAPHIFEYVDQDAIIDSLIKSSEFKSTIDT